MLILINNLPINSVNLLPNKLIDRLLEGSMKFLLNSKRLYFRLEAISECCYCMIDSRIAINDEKLLITKENRNRST